MITADDHLFRCHALGHLMTEGKGKSNFEKWEDAKANLLKATERYESLKDKSGPAGIKLVEKIGDLNKEVIDLEKVKDIYELSESTKTNLVDIQTAKKYNRFTEISSKILDKGNETEENSITTISRVTKQFLKKNTETLKNEYISGTPDVFTGESIYNAETVRDAKSSWDVFTFNRAIYKSVLPLYYWQLQGYMALTKAKVAYLDYCLNNTPYHLVESLLRTESYKHLNMDTPAWIELQIIANHVYDRDTFDQYIHMRGVGLVDDNAHAVYNGFVEIPLSERHHAFQIERNDDDIQRLYKQIEACRSYMNKTFFNK